MQDGHRGQQSYILDGANTGLGVELVTNGDFPTSTTAWTEVGTVSYSGGEAVLTGDGTKPTQLIQTITGLSVGSYYRIKFDYNNVSSDSIRVNMDGTVRMVTSSISTGEYEAVFVSTATSQALRFYAYTDLGEISKLSNISVKAINDKNHATTVFHGDELVTNGTFTSATTGWQGSDAAAGISIVSSRLRVTNGDASAAGFSTTSGSTTFSTIAGRSYLISYDSLQGTSSNASTRLYLGTTFNGAEVHGGTTYTADGTHTYTHTATATQDIYLLIKNVTTTNGQYMDYDNVSIKEIGVASGWTDADQQLHIPQTALQSYNELAWFDGTSASNGYMDLDTQIATTDNDWSLSFWVIRQDTPETSYFIMGNEANKFIALNTATDKLHYRDGNGTYHAISDSGIPYNEWTHVVVTATADTSVLAYVNGVAQTANSNMSDTEIVLKKFMIWISAAHGTLGSINEISYYSDVLTAAEALDLFNDGKAKSALEASGSAGLVGYWRNNGLSEWKDLKGSNDGNTSAGVVETILIPQGVDSTRDAQGFIMNRQKSTSCLNLTWPMYAEINDSDTLDFGTGDFSIECWVKHGYRHTGSAVNTVIALGGDAASASASIISTATVFRFYVGSALVNSTVTLVKDNWYHVVGTRTGTTVRLYVDGAVESGTATSSQNLTNSLSKYVGRDSGSARDYKEAVDGVRLYADALSAGEVLRNYKATKGNHRN